MAQLRSYSGNPNVPGLGGDKGPGYIGNVLFDEVGEVRYFNAINAK